MLSIIVPDLHTIIGSNENQHEMLLEKELDEAREIVSRELLYKVLRQYPDKLKAVFNLEFDNFTIENAIIEMLNIPDIEKSIVNDETLRKYVKEQYSKTTDEEIKAVIETKIKEEKAATSKHGSELEKANTLANFLNQELEKDIFNNELLKDIKDENLNLYVRLRLIIDTLKETDLADTTLVNSLTAKSENIISTII